MTIALLNWTAKNWKKKKFLSIIRKNGEHIRWNILHIYVCITCTFILYLYVYVCFVYLCIWNIAMYHGNTTRKKGILFGCSVDSLCGSGFPTDKQMKELFLIVRWGCDRKRMDSQRSVVLAWLTVIGVYTCLTWQFTQILRRIETSLQLKGL